MFAGDVARSVEIDSNVIYKAALSRREAEATKLQNEVVRKSTSMRDMMNQETVRLQSQLMEVPEGGDSNNK